ncbi:heparinase II/III family protein [Phycicoccus sp. CSK15P-2]|uniref:heparinase II/III domain-containing protein n=1 Tax=Phycicoccus sp. CSK15P-2 TaxID=2807627 RepID=UPI0019514FC3|nr:heparinase II/III family protein [Phycicoccus sp. CSK15P-2]MBM6403505.1 heparinase II/III family protein [Phycicoccus sp. CSK15P-2]
MSSADGVEDPGIDRWLPDAVDGLLNSGLVVPAFEMVRSVEAWEVLSAPVLRRLCVALRGQGFLDRALRAADALEVRDGGPAELGASLRGELAVLGGSFSAEVPEPESPFVARAGRVLNVVGTSLPEVDSTFTRRTQATARRMSRLGLEVSVVTQMGIGETDGYAVEEVDGVEYHRIPGPPRREIPMDEWLMVFANRLSAVVRKVRPGVVVASSDFVNGLAAQAVCRPYGIPLVYDVRGLWEDSWLDRQRASNSWTEEQVPERWGMPEAWSMRRERELQLVETADAVVTAGAQTTQKLVELGTAAERVTEIGDVESDAERWLGVYEDLGALEPGAREIARLGDGPPDPADVRRRVRGSERMPLDRIAGFGGFGTTRSIREGGWRHSSLEPVHITSPFDWAGACLDNRSQGFHLHAWDFMVPFLKSWNRKGDRESLTWCLERASDWAATFTVGDAQGTMAWYDMAIGLRAPRLAYLLQEAVHEDEPDEVVQRLAHAVVRHQHELFRDEAFNPRTNHGFYSAVGQLSFARRLSALDAMDVMTRQGEQRLKVVVATQFAEDGGHLEHSPDYHRMLLASFRDAMEDGLLTDPEVAARLSRAEEVMGWFIQPDRRIVQIGDSPARLVSPEDRAAQEPHTQFIASVGREGSRNESDLLVLRQSGYGIVRSPQPHRREDHLRAGYLTLVAGFHSRAHKHCDDLSLTWFDQEQEILVDSGRFGYLDPLPPDSPDRARGFFYGRPERQYVESTPAHNTVQAGDADHERRDREPYGSGIVSGEERDGHFRLVGRVGHLGWDHERTVTYRPGTWLLVEDRVSSPDPQDFTVWWNLAETLTDPKATGSEVSFGLTGSDRHLRVVSLSGEEQVPVVKGQDDPLRGWRAAVDYEFTPVWSLAHRAAGVTEHVMVTLLTFDESQTSRPRSPFDE